MLTVCRPCLTNFIYSVTNLNKKKIFVSRRYLSRKQVSADLPFTYTMAFFYAPCQFTPLTGLYHILFYANSFFGVTLLGRFISIYFLYYGNVIFYLRPLFQKHNQGVKRGLGI